MKRDGTFKIVLALFIGAFFLSGCGVVEKAALALTEPVFGFAEADAATTNKLIDREEATKLWSEAKIAEARLCPAAVLAFGDLRRQVLDEGEDAIEGTKGLIYLSTKAMFRRDVKEQATTLLRQIVSACVSRLPVDRILLRRF